MSTANDSLRPVSHLYATTTFAVPEPKAGSVVNRLSPYRIPSDHRVLLARNWDVPELKEFAG
jgi:hypothetical protein